MKKARNRSGTISPSTFLDKRSSRANKCAHSRIPRSHFIVISPFITTCATRLLLDAHISPPDKFSISAYLPLSLTIILSNEHASIHSYTIKHSHLDICATRERHSELRARVRGGRGRIISFRMFLFRSSERAFSRT